jgi:hypothetical protein
LRHADAVYEYRCLVGHRYSTRNLLAAHSEAQEKALWSAVVALEEAANIARELAPRFSEEAAARLRLQGENRLKQASEIRAILQQLEPFQPERLFPSDNRTDNTGGLHPHAPQRATRGDK